jgi:hypothetical protein
MVQVNLILHDSLPGFQEELEKATHDTRQKLQALPSEASKDPQTEISTLLHGFVTDFIKLIKGIPSKEGLLQSIWPAQEEFNPEIRGTVPKFLPFERRSARTKKLEKARFLINEEGDNMIYVGHEHKADIICIDEVFKYAHEWVQVSLII